MDCCADKVETKSRAEPTAESAALRMRKASPKEALLRKHASQHELFWVLSLQEPRVEGSRGGIRLHEKSGSKHEMPTHHNFDHYL